MPRNAVPLGVARADSAAIRASTPGDARSSTVTSPFSTSTSRGASNSIREAPPDAPPPAHGRFQRPCASRAKCSAGCRRVSRTGDTRRRSRLSRATVTSARSARSRGVSAPRSALATTRSVAAALVGKPQSIETPPTRTSRPSRAGPARSIAAASRRSPKAAANTNVPATRTSRTTARTRKSLIAPPPRSARRGPRHRSARRRRRRQAARSCGGWATRPLPATASRPESPGGRVSPLAPQPRMSAGTSSRNAS